MMMKSCDSNLFAALLVLGVLTLAVLGCKLPSSGSSMIVRSGCVTPDGSKIALNGIEDMSRASARPTGDGYRLILDGKNGKVTWKDTASGFPLACAEDNSIVSISYSGAKWIDSDKEIVFSQQSDARETSFVGMTDKNTIIREVRQYYQKEMKNTGSRQTTSTIKSFNTLPTLLVDRVGESTTRTITIPDSVVGAEAKDKYFQYYFEKDRVVIQVNKKLYATDLTSGSTRALSETVEEMQRKWAVNDKYDAYEPEQLRPDGSVDIYEGSANGGKVVKQINKHDLSAKVISIIDCCNNGLLLLFWEREKYVKVAKIDHLSGEVIWKSDSLMSADQK